MAIDDEIDATRKQIEFTRKSPAAKAVSTILDTLVGFGVPALKPASTVMKRLVEQREDNTAYLVEAVILRLRTLEEQFKALSEEHKRFIQSEGPRLLLEAAARAETIRSRTRIDRLSLIVVNTLLEGAKVDLDSADDMLRVTVDLSERDIDVLAKIYAVQANALAQLNFLPEQNMVNSSWRDLQSKDPLFKSAEIHSICAKLQGLGLVTQVPPIPTTLDLNSVPYSVLREGALYLRAIGFTPQQ